MSSSMLAPGPSSASTSSGASSSNDQQIRLQILASLFPPGSQNGSYIAHVKTWEDVSGAPPGSAESKKARYILLAVQTDGRLKIHKSKRNNNGTFSIGKTWNMEDLRALEVHKPRTLAPGGSQVMTCFTITMGNKSYLWETESSRQQDDFLVTLVRSFRQYTNGGASLKLSGFQVGEIPGAPPAYTVPIQGGGAATPTMASPNLAGGGGAITSAAVPRTAAGAGATTIPRPTTSASMVSNESSYYGQQPQIAAGGSSLPVSLGASSYPDSAGMRQQPSSRSLGQQPLPSPLGQQAVNNGGGQTATHTAAASSSFASNPSADRGYSGMSSAVTAAAARRKASQGMLAAGSGPSSGTGGASVPSTNLASSSNATSMGTRLPSSAGAQSSSLDVPSSQMTSRDGAARAPTPTRPNGTAPKGRSNNTADAATKTTTPGAGADESTAAAKAAALLGQQRASLQDDSDVMLTNVEEMLEGLEWGQGGNGIGGADQVEKRLIGELNALEAAGIHAIIESDDRVIDVVKYLDNALAELDKLDQLITLYKTHLHAVSDDTNFIESQNQGLQIQSSNQRALLAELDTMLGP